VLANPAPDIVAAENTWEASACLVHVLWIDVLSAPSGDVRQYQVTVESRYIALYRFEKPPVRSARRNGLGALVEIPRGVDSDRLIGEKIMHLLLTWGPVAALLFLRLGSFDEVNISVHIKQESSWGLL